MPVSPLSSTYIRYIGEQLCHMVGPLAFSWPNGEPEPVHFVKTVTSADDPAGTWSAGGPLQETRTGTRCTTFTKLPEALSGGRREKVAPVPPERLSSFPSN